MKQSPRKTGSQNTPIFDYRTLRLVMGLVAISLPFIVSLLSNERLSSISAAYHTSSRDMFVGLLFIVSAFLFACNGFSFQQARASKIASFSATLIAILPCRCNTCPVEFTGVTHYISAMVLFSILTYFCFKHFQNDTRGQPGKKGRRSKIYFTCGWLMIFSMAAVFLGTLLLDEKTMAQWRVTYYAESVALIAFGFAWIISGKVFKVIAEEDERLHLFE